MAKIKEVISITASTHNILATGTQITGDICAEEDFRIDGTTIGNITCKGKIVIGTSGVVSGDIKCTNIEILGRLNGNINCPGSVVLRASALFTGNIISQTLEIEPGAKIEGTCSMYKEE